VRETRAKIVDAKTIAVIRTDRMGDLILTTPLFQAIKEASPEARVLSFASPYAAPVIERNPHVDETILWRNDAREMSRALAARRPEAAILLNPSFRACAAVWRAGIPFRTGPLSRPSSFLFLNRGIRQTRSRSPRHQSELDAAFAPLVTGGRAGARARRVLSPPLSRGERARGGSAPSRAVRRGGKKPSRGPPRGLRRLRSPLAGGARPPPRTSSPRRRMVDCSYRKRLRAPARRAPRARDRPRRVRRRRRGNPPLLLRSSFTPQPIHRAEHGSPPRGGRARRSGRVPLPASSLAEPGSMGTADGARRGARPAGRMPGAHSMQRRALPAPSLHGADRPARSPRGDPRARRTGGSTGMREALSVVIITRNEEDEIEECLRSVSWADEIVLVDSHSSDRTVEIARRFTDRIHQRAFSGFTDQKQWATDRARGPWILNIDADERVPEALRAEIEAVLEQGTSSRPASASRGSPGISDASSATARGIRTGSSGSSARTAGDGRGGACMRASRSTARPARSGTRSSTTRSARSRTTSPRSTASRVSRPRTSPRRERVDPFSVFSSIRPRRS